MSDEADRVDRDEGRTGAAHGRTHPGQRGAPAEDDDGAFAPLAADGPIDAPPEVAADRSRIDGLPEGWSSDPVGPAERAGSGPLDLIAEAHDALHGAAGTIDESGISHASMVLIGTGQSGIVVASDVIPGDAVAGPAGPFTRGGGADSGSAVDVASLGDGLPVRPETAGDDAPAAVDEWGDIAATADDMPSESVGFGALLTHDAADQGLASDSFTGDSQGIVEGVGEAIEVATPVIAARRRAAPSKGGLGQLVGVVLGGVLAIPVTLAILLWGFQRDPFGVAASVPEGLRFLLPKSVQRQTEPRGRSGAVAGSSLDTIANEASATLQATSGPADLPAADPTAPPTDPLVDATTIEPSPAGNGPEAAVDAISSSDLDPTRSDEPTLAIEAPDVARPNPGAASTPVLPDLGTFDAAVERALVATEELGRIDPAADPQLREQRLVTWYRGLADAATALALAERTLADVGVAPTEAVRRYGGLAERLASERGAEIADLGTMWLTAARRPSDGVVLVGVLEEERQAGPWHWGTVALGGGEPRRMAFFARAPSGAQAGEEVLVTGVLGDRSTMWASDVRALPGERRSAAVIPDAGESPASPAGDAGGAGGP